MEYQSSPSGLHHAQAPWGSIHASDTKTIQNAEVKAMIHGERVSCTNWLIATFKERIGKESINRPTRKEFQESLNIDQSPGYKPEDCQEALEAVLPKELADRIHETLSQVGNYWDVWPKLADMDIGVIMMAGAANY